ncbi:unnamed protein product [Lasius platythorax]|uniref:Uncharacterized protein n=1 Tax=Lasius platythorax TaxID=488582 RepID=A0AAV2NEJ7_9HYME
MLSNAIAFSTASFLSINDLSAREWSGIDNRFEYAHGQRYLSDLKEALFSGPMVHHDVEDVFSNFNEWDLDIMADYWMLDPYGSIQWLTYSPVPMHCSLQWISKLELQSASSTPKGVTTFNYRRTTHMAIKLTKENGERCWYYRFIPTGSSHGGA